MNTNFNSESAKKGEQFENFVQNTIFPEAHYDLLYKTSDSKQNTHRFVKKSLEPDFQFKCRLSGKVFHVEAKWRAKPYKNKYDVLTKDQFQSFPEVHSEDKPIYIAFGFGGTADNPDYLSLIPYTVIDDRRLEPQVVYNYKIDKSRYPNERLLNESTKDKKSDIDSDKEPIEKTKNNYKLLGLAAIGLLAIIISVFAFAFPQTKTTPKEKFREIIGNYYQDMNSNQVEKIPDYLSPKIDSWYGDKNPTQEEVIRNARRHRGKFPYSSSQIDWDSFTVIREQTGNYHVSYEMIYKSKENINDDYTVYDLKLITKWDQDYKLKSITEIRNGDKT